MPITVHMPDSAKEYEARLHKLGAKFSYKPDYALSRIDKTRRSQVRDSDHVAPQASVSQFAIVMAQRGPLHLPPIIVSKDDGLSDGNTREAAATKLGMSTFHAFIVDARYDGTAEEQALLGRIGASFNQANGVRLTRKEAINAIQFYEGVKAEKVAGELCLPVATVNKARREMEARTRLTRLGLVVTASEFLNTIGAPSVLLLNDGPFKRLVDLIQRADLSKREAIEIAKGLREAGSDDAADDALDAQFEEFAERIARHERDGNGRKPTKLTRFRSALAAVLAFQGQEDSLVDRTSELTAMGHYIGRLEEAQEVIDIVLEEQKGVVEELKAEAEAAEAEEAGGETADDEPEDGNGDDELFEPDPPAPPPPKRRTKGLTRRSAE